MDKQIIDLVNNFTEWKGNAFTLATLVSEKQKEIDAQKLQDAGYTDAVEVLQ